MPPDQSGVIVDEVLGLRRSLRDEAWGVIRLRRHIAKSAVVPAAPRDHRPWNDQRARVFRGMDHQGEHHPWLEETIAFDRAAIEGTMPESALALNLLIEKADRTGQRDAVGEKT